MAKVRKKVVALLKQTTAALGSGQIDKAFSLCREPGAQKESEKWYRESVQAEPSKPGAWQGLLELFSKESDDAQRHEKSIPILRELIKIFSALKKIPKVRNYRKQLVAGLCCSKKWDEADQILEDVLARLGPPTAKMPLKKAQNTYGISRDLVLLREDRLRHDHNLTPEQPWVVPAAVSATAVRLVLKCRETLDLMLKLQKLFPNLDFSGLDATARIGTYLQMHLALAGVLGQGQEEARSALIQWATKDLDNTERLRVLLLVFGEEDGAPLPEATVWL